jgi:catechol 2,3-dioxygenase-like lactoylglutathione lyase family enzyme
MSYARVTGLRSVELGVVDLNRSAEFYSQVWGLQEVASAGDTVHLRGTGSEHHVLTLRERPKANLLGVHFAAPNREAVTLLHARAKAYGAYVLGDPAALPLDAGGGFGFAFRTPEGQPLSISADVEEHPDVVRDRSKPTKLTHVVLNSARIGEEINFFMDLLGFRLSDSTHMMEFIRCCSDHHSVALARGNGPSLNHMAYEMQNIDGLMRGSGRLKQNGFNIEWGVGRHGPGDNVFSYFIEPNGFVTEYTTEVEQVDEAVYVANTPEYWAVYPMRPCRWGMATQPSNRVKFAMSGKLAAGEEPEDESLRCDDVIARRLGR